MSVGLSVPDKAVAGAPHTAPADTEVVRPATASRASRWPAALLPWVTSLALLGLWELLARTGVLPDAVPPVTTIVRQLVELVPTAAFGDSIAATAEQFVLALLMGGAAGVVLGVLLGTLPIAYHLMHYSLDFLRFIPAIVYLPVLILVMGATPRMCYLLAALGAIWPLLFQTYYGVTGTSIILRDTGRVFGLRLHQRLLHIILPSVAPFIATGVRIAASHVLIVVVAVEIIASVDGLGNDIGTYATNGVYPQMYALVLVVGVLGVAVNYVLEWIERRQLHWHAAHRRAES